MLVENVCLEAFPKNARIEIESRNSQIYFVLCQVLDIGCGTGGSAFYMARNYGVDVYGFDLSTNMIGIAQDYRSDKKTGVIILLV